MITWNLKTDSQHYDNRGYWEYDSPRQTIGTTRESILADISAQLGEKVVLDENILGGFRFVSPNNRRVFGYVSFWS